MSGQVVTIIVKILRTIENTSLVLSQSILCTCSFFPSQAYLLVSVMLFLVLAQEQVRPLLLTLMFPRYRSLGAQPLEKGYRECQLLTARDCH